MDEIKITDKHNSLSCEKCNGIMKKKNYKTTGIVIFAIILFMMGLGLLFSPAFIVGILVIILSFIVGSKENNVWECISCGYFFNRN